jgi:hypothetical protein
MTCLFNSFYTGFQGHLLHEADHQQCLRHRRYDPRCRKQPGNDEFFLLKVLSCLKMTHYFVKVGTCYYVRFTRKIILTNVGCLS